MGTEVGKLLCYLLLVFLEEDRCLGTGFVDYCCWLRVLDLVLRDVISDANWQLVGDIIKNEQDYGLIEFK